MSKKTIEHVEKPTQVVDVGMQQLKYGHVPSKENDMNHNEQWFQSDLSWWHIIQKHKKIGNNMLQYYLDIKAP